MSEMLKVDGGLLQATFPNVGIALRTYLTIPVTNCEGERSFSTLSRVKNHLRTRMTQQRLQALSLMCIESEVLQSVDFDDIINDFAKQKTRKRDLIVGNEREYVVAYDTFMHCSLYTLALWHSKVVMVYRLQNIVL